MKPEILAPAGDFRCLKAALSGGANAVYLGLHTYSARAQAKNFSLEEVVEAVKYCHERDAKVYVTLNTLMDDRELEEFVPIIGQLNRIGIDAVIVQDLGLVQLLQTIAPDLPIHASTQMTVHSLDGVEFLHRFGIQRVVLARELSKEEIGWIAQNTSCELEVFVHGALCVSYSGQCLMSSFLGGRSGNRGKCAQPCRLLYSAGMEKNQSILSLKDLSLIDHILELAQMGVSSFKIEGRMKGLQYVGTVTSIYRKYLDQKKMPSQEDLDILYHVFNRGGYTDGYFMNKAGKEMFCFNKPDNPFAKQSTVYKQLEEKPAMLIPIFLSYEIKAGEPAKLSAKTTKGMITVYSDMPAAIARTAALTSEKICLQLEKFGDTCFDVKQIDGKTESNVFLPVSELNALRRKLVAKLNETFFEKKIRRLFPYQTLKTKKRNNDASFTLEVLTKSQLEAAIGYPFSRIYLPVSLLQEVELFPPEQKFYVVLPRIMKDHEKSSYIRILEEKKDLISGICVGNVGQISWAKCFGLPIHGDLGLNIFNSRGLFMLEKAGFESATLSCELSTAKIKSILPFVNTEIIVYGRMPLMIMENCIARITNNNVCCSNKSITLTDRKGEKFPVIKNGLYCRSEIFNAKYLYLADKLQELKKLNVSFFRLKMTDETANTCKSIIEAYLYEKKYNLKEFTRGYFFKNID